MNIVANELVTMNTMCFVAVSVVGTLLAVCFAAVGSKKFCVTIDYNVEGFQDDDCVGLVSKVGSSKAAVYGAVVNDVEDGGGGVAAAASKKDEPEEEDFTQDDGGCMYAADVTIKWFPSDSPKAMVNTSYKVAYGQAKLEVDWNIKPWIISWDVGEPNFKEYGAVMVACTQAVC